MVKTRARKGLLDPYGTFFSWCKKVVTWGSQ